MKKIAIAVAALLLLGFILLIFTREVPFPSDAQADFDARLKSWAGKDFNYQIVALRNAARFSANGPWCIVIQPAVQRVATPSEEEEIDHFSMLKEGELWVMVHYDRLNQTNWGNLGCGEWD